MPKRKAKIDEETVQQLQRTKSAVDEAFAELICPISHVLPIDPVTAEDGKVYERSAIAEWLQRHQRSPLTNEAMGTRLIPSTQAKSMIRTMVKSGAIVGAIAEAWQEKLEGESMVEELRRKAVEGDGDAMGLLASFYFMGRYGLVKDEVTAFHWYKKSHEAGCVYGTATLGGFYLKGIGIPAHTVKAAVLLTSAAERGNDFASYMLGSQFADGTNGFTKDLAEARHWYSKVASSSANISLPQMEQAAAWLHEHPA